MFNVDRYKEKILESSPGRGIFANISPVSRPKMVIFSTNFEHGDIGN